MIYKSYLVEQNINSISQNLVLFYGENLGLKDDFKDIIKKNNKDTYIKNFDQDQILSNKIDFINELFNESLFEEKKIFFINNANDKLLKLIQEIELKTNLSKIYFFSDILDKKSKLRDHFEKSKACAVIACYTDNEISIKKIIQNKLKNFTGLTSDNINIIFDNCNFDRIKLNNELSKILSYFDKKKIITEELEFLLNIKVNDSFNNLKDEALIGNKIKTNSLISETEIEPEKNILYLNIINQRLLKLLEIYKLSTNSNLEDAISRIKPPIFWKDKDSFLKQAKKLNKKKIQNLLDKTHNLEFILKTNATVKQNTLIKNLLVEMCVLANS